MNYRNDIDYLIKQLEQTHPDLYRNVDKNIVNDIIATAKERDFSPREFKLFAAQLVAMFKDPHTVVDFGSNESKYSFKMVDDEIYLINPDNSMSKVSSFNNITTEQIINQVKKYIAFDNKSGYIASIEECLSDIDFMKELLGTDSITFESEDNMIYDLCEKGEKELFGVSLESGNLTIKLGTCNQSNGELKEFVDRCTSMINNSNVQNVTLDLRGNKGGSSEVVAPLIEAISAVNNKTTLVDEHTFSSAVLIMQKMRENGSVIAGCEPGLTQNHFGDCTSFSLPDSNIKVWCSTCEFVMNEGKIVKITKEEQIDEENTKVTAYGQEFIVPKSILAKREDYKIDEYIDSVISENKISK